jgi:hypothetical protein
VAKILPSNIPRCFWVKWSANFFRIYKIKKFGCKIEPRKNFSPALWNNSGKFPNVPSLRLIGWRVGICDLWGRLFPIPIESCEVKSLVLKCCKLFSISNRRTSGNLNQLTHCQPIWYNWTLESGFNSNLKQQIWADIASSCHVQTMYAANPLRKNIQKCRRWTFHQFLANLIWQIAGPGPRVSTVGRGRFHIFFVKLNFLPPSLIFPYWLIVFFFVAGCVPPSRRGSLLLYWTTAR